MSASRLAISGMPNHTMPRIAAAAASEAAAMRHTETAAALPGPSRARHRRRILARAAGSRSSSRASSGAAVQASLSTSSGPSTRRTESYGQAARGAPSGASESAITSRSAKARVTSRRRLDRPSKKMADSIGRLEAEIETVRQPLAKRVDDVAGGGDIRRIADVDHGAGLDHPSPDPLQRVDAREHTQGDA